MKKIFLLSIILCTVIVLPLTAPHDCDCHHNDTVLSVEYVKDMVMGTYNNALGWYNEHTMVARVGAALGVAYLLYKQYCPVASRCKECSSDSKK